MDRFCFDISDEGVGQKIKSYCSRRRLRRLEQEMFFKLFQMTAKFGMNADENKNIGAGNKSVGKSRDHRVGGKI